MKIVVSHPTGNRNVRAVLNGLLKKDMLVKFVTTITIRPNNFFMMILRGGLRQQLLRRSYPVPSNLIISSGFREFVRLVSHKYKLERILPGLFNYSIDAVYNNVDKVTAHQLTKLSKREKIDAVYCYEDGALETFETAKSFGLTCIYDLPIAYWETGRRLMQEEALRLPEWAPTLGGGITDPESKLTRKVQELENADIIICPSKFVQDSLPVWARNKHVIMAPFGSPTVTKLDLSIKKKDAGRPLRVLFAGSMGQRKGLGDLFAAIKLIDSSQIELVVMGSLLAPIEFYRQQLPRFTHELSRPHAQVLELMQSCDIFCLPSIVEGRALVMQEAMSQGLPIIITRNTGGGDLVKEGETGFIVPIRSPAKIAEKLAWFTDNIDKIPEMGIKAQQHAATYTWERYVNTIIKGITN